MGSLLKNIISFSLYGTNKIYWCGALRNIELAKKYYPNYICRFYIEKEYNPDLLSFFTQRSDIEVILMDRSLKHSGMFWRMLGAVDPNVDVCLVRDIDSIISIRDKNLVEEWLDSNKNFHIIRDNPMCVFPIFGGAWGCRNHVLHKTRFAELLPNKISKYQKYGDDQKFLIHTLYPEIYHTSFEHSRINKIYKNTVHYIEPSIDYIGKKIGTAECNNI